MPINERGPRLSEGIEVIRKLWTGEKVSHGGRFYSFKDVKMTPAPRRPGDHRSGAAAAPSRRSSAPPASPMAGSRTPCRPRCLPRVATIEAAAQRPAASSRASARRHLMFTRIGDSYERALDEAAGSLSVRYAMNMRPATERYGAIGTPAQVADKIRAFHSPASAT